MSSYDNVAMMSDGFEQHWSVNDTEATIRIAAKAQTAGWLAIGLSEVGTMVGCDALVAWFAEGRVYATDRFIFNKTVEGVALDDQQDWRVLGGIKTTEQSTGDTWTTMHVWRQLDTGDCNDRPIVAGRQHNLIWAMGETNDFVYYGTSSRGSLSLVLVPAPAPSILAPPSPPSVSSASAEASSQYAADLGQANGQLKVQQLNWTLSNFAVPASNATTYVCKVFDVPATSKVHIVEFGALLNSTYTPSVHHGVIYGCSQAEYPNVANATGTFDCISGLPCHTTVAMWAMGGRPFVDPDGVGYPVGRGYFTKFVLQLPLARCISTTLISAPTSSTAPASTSKSPTLLAPPTQASCSSAFPPECPPGLKPARAPARARLLNTNWQQVQPIYPQFQLLPGDELKTTCVWDSSSRSQVTPGGPATSDEMCVGYLIYYPARPAQVLGSCSDFCAAWDSVNNTFDMNPKSPNLTTFYLCGGLNNPYIPTSKKCSMRHGANVPFKVLTGCPAKTAGSLAVLSSSNISVAMSSPTNTTAPPPPTSPSKNST
ncbi:unnamed protein product [Closterium sp. Naga37s-1]|nr:unnamed protein product [Closterium sp. Naga37s-1]